MSLATNASLQKAYRTDAMRNADLLRAEFAATEGLRSSVIVEEGVAEAVILGVTERERANLIVTGIAGSGPLSRMLLGSTVTALARTSPVPVLVVKKKVRGGNVRAVLATDLSESSKPALVIALQCFSRDYLALFHAFDPPYRAWADDKEAYDKRFQESVIEQCRSFVNEVVGGHAQPNLDVIARRGDPVAGLRVVINEADINLVVAGTHGRTGLMHVLLGSVASRILNEVASDVLIVPSRRR